MTMLYISPGCCVFYFSLRGGDKRQGITVSLPGSQGTVVRLNTIYSALYIFLSPYFQIEHKVSAAQIAFRKMNLTKNYIIH